MSDFDPLPPKPMTANQNWGEKDLISYCHHDGFHYFVQFDTRDGDFQPITQRDKATAWLQEHGIDYSWVGGRSAFELCFKKEEDAVMFKLAYGI